MIFYRHGSEDSLDIDVFYVFEQMPSFQECKEFCSNKQENRNIIVIKNGIVTECFKGTPDEINNGLIATYPLHHQEHPLVIEKSVDRDKLLKIIRVVRCLLSYCSRTQYRSEVKLALKSNSWETKINVLRSINFREINNFGKSNREDVLKVLAFQLGQAFGLLEELDEFEFYTKSSIANEYTFLQKYLYRKKDSCINDLYLSIIYFIEQISHLNIEEKSDYVYFKDFDKNVNLIKEKYVE